jgi:radical SAM superfamily enzyme YgiQ (UPF0313 family)
MYSLSQNYGAKFMPVWAFTLASWLDREIEKELFDTQVIKYESITSADIFLFSGINQDLGFITEILKFLKIKYPTKLFIIGGPICWSLHQSGNIEVLNEFDHICVGDGELILPELIKKITAKQDLPKLILEKARFKTCNAKIMDRELLEKHLKNYYGGIVEVSRGCPFLCEFCDIRVMNDNNRSHSFQVAHLIAEIDYQVSLGVQKITLACDNFIGDLKFAEEFVDEIILWRERSKSSASFYTWLTVNLYNYPVLMQKMRKAGFDLLFIGIESFNQNSLLETAKVQNSSMVLVDSIKQIQSYGFIVIAGIIFGFDSDEDDFTKITLDGLRDAGLISGDPNWLTALPGTPLHLRMRLSNRLRNNWDTHGAYKFQTNIKYLINKSYLISEFLGFIKAYSSSKYQYERYKEFILTLSSKNYISNNTGGFGDPVDFLVNTFSKRSSTFQLLNRLYHLVRNPFNVFAIIKAFGLTVKQGRSNNFIPYFLFWVFTWSNVMVKYSKLEHKDFDIESVENPGQQELVPSEYESLYIESIPVNKIKAQRQRTINQLKKIKRS